MDSESSVKVGLGERVRAYLRSSVPTAGTNVDNYLSLHLPDLIQEYNLGLRSELRGISGIMAELEKKVDELDLWKGESTEKMESLKHRLEILETKYGVKEA